MVTIEICKHCNGDVNDFPQWEDGAVLRGCNKIQCPGYFGAIANADWPRVAVAYKVHAHKENKELIKRIKRLSQADLLRIVLESYGICSQAQWDEEGMATRVRGYGY